VIGERAEHPLRGGEIALDEAVDGVGVDARDPRVIHRGDRRDRVGTAIAHRQVSERLTRPEDGDHRVPLRRLALDAHEAARHDPEKRGSLTSAEEGLATGQATVHGLRGQALDVRVVHPSEQTRHRQSTHQRGGGEHLAAP
jgi:hypothetical protein